MNGTESDRPPPSAPAPPWRSRFHIFLHGSRLVCGVLSLGLGVLPFIPAPSRLAWMLTVGVTEWGHIAALLGLVLLLPGWRNAWPARIGAALGFAGALLALSTIVRGKLIADDVRIAFSKSFGSVEPRSVESTPTRTTPLSIGDVLLGISSPSVQTRTATYVTRNGTPLQMDIYAPPVTGEPAPVVLMIHGGSWRSGTRTELPEINRYLAARGYLVASIDYRLAPEHPFPAALDDVRAAIDYLKNHAVELSLDPDRIVLMGRSAGGHLALLGAYKFEDTSIRGVVSYYAPTDLVYAHANPSNPRVLDSTKVLEDFLGGSPTTVPKTYEEASPVNFVKNDSPPTLLIHGQRDDVVYKIHAEKLAARLKEHTIPHFLLTLPWGNHGCDANLSGPGGQLSLYVIERFLASVMLKKVPQE